MTNRNVVFLAPCDLAFVRMTGPYAVSSISAWDRLLDWLARRGHKPPDDVGFGLALDDPRTTLPELLRYDACVKRPATFSDIDIGVAHLQHFRGGAYFKTMHRGSYSTLGHAVSLARNELLPRTGLMRDETRPVLTLFYSYPSTTPPEAQIAEICIPVFPDRRLTPREDM